MASFNRSVAVMTIHGLFCSSSCDANLLDCVDAFKGSTTVYVTSFAWGHALQLSLSPFGFYLFSPSELWHSELAPNCLRSFSVKDHNHIAFLYCHHGPSVGIIQTFRRYSDGWNDKVISNSIRVLYSVLVVRIPSSLFCKHTSTIYIQSDSLTIE